ncbi:MAG TPA: hypothetical protein VFF67_06740 [Thermoplasmata archaeon]|nr:hypothetical protein [Thermoplasmata archaeon]
MTPKSRTATGPAALVAAAVALALALALPVLAPPTASLAPRGAGRATSVPSFHRSGYCGWDKGPQPAAIHAGVPEPTFALRQGDSISIAYEVAAQNYTASDKGLVVHVPSVFGLFPTTQGTTVSILLYRQNLTINGPGFTNASLASATKALTSGVAFPKGGTANLTSEKLAVQADVAKYGALTLQLRWHWITDQSANRGGVTTGNWSTLTYRTTQVATPTIFLAAPFVDLLAHTGPTAVIGNNYTASVDGADQSTSFNLEIENATGTIYRQLPITTPAAPPDPQVVAIAIMGDDNGITPGAYLFHLHDHCGAILYSVPVKLAYPSSASLHLGVSPSACGPLSFGGSSYASGSRATVTPSSTAVALSVGSCSGHAFNHWGDSGGADVATSTTTSTSAVTSANGSVVAVFS